MVKEWRKMEEQLRVTQCPFFKMGHCGLTAEKCLMIHDLSSTNAPEDAEANESTIEESVAGSSERQASPKREPKDQVNGDRGKSEPDQEPTNAKPHGSSALYAEGQGEARICLRSDSSGDYMMAMLRVMWEQGDNFSLAFVVRPDRNMTAILPKSDLGKATIQLSDWVVAKIRPTGQSGGQTNFQAFDCIRLQQDRYKDLKSPLQGWCVPGTIYDRTIATAEAKVAAAAKSSILNPNQGPGPASTNIIRQPCGPPPPGGEGLKEKAWNRVKDEVDANAHTKDSNQNIVKELFANSVAKECEVNSVDELSDALSRDLCLERNHEAKNCHIEVAMDTGLSADQNSNEVIDIKKLIGDQIIGKEPTEAELVKMIPEETSRTVLQNTGAISKVFTTKKKGSSASGIGRSRSQIPSGKTLLKPEDPLPTSVSPAPQFIDDDYDDMPQLVSSIKEWGDMGDTKASTTGGEGLLLGDVGAVTDEAASIGGGSHIPQGKRDTKNLSWKWAIRNGLVDQIPPRFREFELLNAGESSITDPRGAGAASILDTCSKENDLRQAAAVIEDDPVKHYCHTCKKYDVALNLGGQCPHCRGDFVELQDKGFWSNVSMEDLLTYKLSKNDQRVLGKEEFRSGSPSALGPPPGFAQNISSAGDSAADSPNRSGGLGTKSRKPLRKPKVSTTRTFYCYSCKADVPFLCGQGDNKRCPTCKSDFVEDKETAKTHLQSEKEIKTQKELKQLKERSAVQHARYACHPCGHKSTIKAGQELRCVKCGSDFIEEIKTWADTAGPTAPGSSGDAPSTHRVTELKEWICHKCLKISVIGVGQTLVCSHCKSEFLEEKALNQSYGQNVPNGQANPNPVQQHTPQGFTMGSGSGGDWQRYFRTGSDLIERASAPTVDEDVGLPGTNRVNGSSAGSNMLSQLLGSTATFDQSAKVLNDLAQATDKLVNKLKAKLGDDFYFDMSQCCQKPFQVVQGADGGRNRPIDLKETERKIRNSLKNVAVLLGLNNFNNKNKKEPEQDENRPPPGHGFDDAVSEISTAIQHLEKMCVNLPCLDGLNRRAEYNLRLVRASFNVRCGELREAKQDIAVALDLMLLSSWARPPDATPHAMRALILHSQGKADEAQRDMAKAIAIDNSWTFKIGNFINPIY